MEHTLRCTACGKEIVPSKWIWRCTCGSPLEVKLPELQIDLSVLRPRWDIWRYKLVLPTDAIASLGEGYTPIIRRKVYDVEVVFKLEYLNPTGSFKDRGTAVTIARCLELNINTIAEDSSGNAGLSAAFYARAHGMKAYIYVPQDAPEGKIALIRLSGAYLVTCRDREEAAIKAMHAEREYIAYVGHLWNPYFIEGTKTIAYELYEQMQGDVVDVAFVPVASGTLLLGLYKGFKELREQGLIDHVPRIIAVQGASCAPVYEILKGAKIYGVSALADGLRVRRPPRLHQIIAAIKDTEGDCIVVDDSLIRGALKDMLSMGFLVEPTSATVLAALSMALEQGLVDRDELVFLPLTGSGLKVVTTLTKAMEVQG